jgi:long-chain acyl-CoA synthetase
MAQTLVHMLQNSVQKVPDADAIVYGQARISYAQLWTTTLSVTNFLRTHGLQKHDRIAILIENSPEYVATYYGAQAAGGVVVGLNTTAKARDLENWIRHCGATWLFVNSRHPELPSLLQTCSKDFKIVLVGENNTIQSEYTWENIINNTNKYFDLSKITDSNDAAAIIYTSGTTGNPKGVTLSHKNLVTNIQSILSYLRLTAKDRILNVLPFYYTYGNSVLHTHLAIGGSIVLENSMMYPHRILEKMVSEKVTGFSGVPSTFSLLLGRTSLRDYDLSSVRYMTQAGGPMPPANIKQLLEELPHIQFFVMYGQTEASARLTYLPPEKLFEKMGSVGIPIPGVKIEIHSEQDKVVDVGVTGEICANGDNIMLGYWKDPNGTKQVLKNGWLHTGDLAHMDSDGFIYIDGRSSEMIKSGANRISPKEIEEIIAELPEVQEVAVVGVADDILGQIIKAVIVPKPGYSLESKVVQAYCKNNLASYKIPKIIDFIDEIPKTASGKIKRFQLQ